MVENMSSQTTEISHYNDFSFQTFTNFKQKQKIMYLYDCESIRVDCVMKGKYFI